LVTAVTSALGSEVVAAALRPDERASFAQAVQSFSSQVPALFQVDAAILDTEDDSHASNGKGEKK